MTQIIKTYYDGAQFGELADFDDQTDLLGADLIKQLQQQKSTSEAIEKSFVFRINKKIFN